MNITIVVMLCTTDAKKMTQFHFFKIDFIVKKIENLLFDEHSDRDRYVSGKPSNKSHNPKVNKFSYVHQENVL